MADRGRAGSGARPSGRPIAAVLAVVPRGREVLLVRRANPPDAGLWGFPGGKIEAGEALARAALRELREETGTDARAVGVLTALDAIGPKGAASYHYVMVAVLCAWTAGEPAAADDADEAAWFDVGLLSSGRVPLSEGVADLAALAVERGAGGHPTRPPP